MQIERVELREVSLPLRAPFATSFGSIDRRRILLVRVYGDGSAGWGECAADDAPLYCPETVDTAWVVLERFAVPALLADPLDHPRQTPDRLASIRGNPMAKSALEAAAWDLWAREEQVPLWQALGGSPRPVPVGVSVGLQPDLATLCAAVEGFLAQGYLRIKLKVRPGQDLEPLREVRRRWPEVSLTADANGAYRLEDADLLGAFDELSLGFLEQPLRHDDLHDHARLAELIDTPICLDESIRHAHDAEVAVRIGAARVLNLKAGRVGGLSEALAVHDVALGSGTPLWCGGMLESGVGRAHNVALATLPGFTLPSDLSASSRYWDRDLVHPPWELVEGHLLPAVRPGIGVEVDEEYLDRRTARRTVLR